MMLRRQATDPEMPAYRLIVAYDGTRFNGFQRQMNNTAMNDRSKQRPPKRPHWETAGRKKRVAATIQDCLEDAMTAWSEQSVESVGLRFASRTDKGVHARGQVIVVNLPAVDEVWPLQNALNSRLPSDISIESVAIESNADFDPRHHAKRKRYSYTVKYRRKLYDSSGTVLPICTVGPHSFRHAFDAPCLWVIPWSVDDQSFHGLCKQLSGEHDYRAFVHKEDRSTRDHVMNVQMSFQVESVSQDPAPIVVARFVVEAEGFRRSMIRNLVGFVIDVGRGEATMDESLWIGNEAAAARVHSAPACGLCLERVDY